MHHPRRLALAVASVFVCASLTAQVPPRRDREPPRDSRPRPDDDSPPNDRDRREIEFRSYDGSGNNPREDDMGAAHARLVRALPSDYADDVSALAGSTRPSPRAISNAVAAQNESLENELGASDFLWQWGQFLDHDIDLTHETDPPEAAPILVPTGDPFFDPQGTGIETILLHRSIFDPETGTGPDNPREQVNSITAWIDASNVYGSGDERARALRTLDGTGQLRTSAGDLLPFNTEGLDNAGGPDPSLFLAGDIRANEQVGLIVLHTLFVREHNRLARELADRNPGMSGEDIYQRARSIVAGEMQVITYREYLPELMGRRALDPYRGYDPDVDAGIRNIFSTACYRYGHSALSPTLLRLDENGDDIPEGSLGLRDAFFRPDRVVNEGGLDPILRGLASQACQTIDPYVIDDVRNFLFGPPGAGGF
ncbi:MAG: peroxidase family protein, partial [Planctomycetota bacterium]